MPPSQPSLSVEESRRRLRAAGLRRTSSRVAVLRCLATAKSPLTHAEVVGELVPRGFDKTTIYRSLIEMSEAGIVTRFDLGDHVWRFELREVAGHPHFVCLDCGRVTCLPEIGVRLSPDLDQAAPPGEVTEILLKGHCQECN